MDKGRIQIGFQWLKVKKGNGGPHLIEVTELSKRRFFVNLDFSVGTLFFPVVKEI